jgi:DNA-binding MltR family transcriptional regulator
MPEFDNDKVAEELKKYGINLADVVQDTHGDTMIRVTHLTEEMLELAIKKSTLKSGKEINERAFMHYGELATLEKKINKAKELNLIDEVAFKDAHLLRKIRNKFAHRNERLHFDSAKIVALAKQLSTYEKAEFNQDVILAADLNIVEQIKRN